MSFERVTARVAEGAVEFSFPDGSTTSAPAHIVAKSALPRDALESDSEEQCFCLPVPQGLLSSWLQLHSNMDSEELLCHADAGILGEYLKVLSSLGLSELLWGVLVS